MNILTRAQLFAYGALSLPLAMAALPVYVQVPKFYAGTLGMNLAWAGAILLALRILDALQDPLLGYLSDRLNLAMGARRFFIALAMPLLALGFFLLFNPGARGGLALEAWLTLSLILVYLGYSMASISYQALGAELSADPYQRTRITATREGLALIGVLLAAALPEVLAEKNGAAAGLAQFSILFLPVLLLAAMITLVYSPQPARIHAQEVRESLFKALLAPFANRGFCWLLAVFVMSGIAAAIPATLFLFFVDDVLGAAHYSGAFLALYFVSGAAGMPLWVMLSKRAGKKAAWIAAMFLAIATFIWASLLGNGDASAFFVICVLSGCALGADLALPPSLLADVIDEDRRGARSEGAYFGLWNLATKLNLALAAGIALPLLAWFGYQPGQHQGGFALAATYALLPSVLKLIAVLLLWLAPLGMKQRFSQ
ncbi:MAG: MFS transporter [Burkholderiales bacterium]